MKITDVKIGQTVVRAKGDYVVGQVSEVIEIDFVKERIKTTMGYWVKVDSFEPITIPYKIISGFWDNKRGKYVNPKYTRL